MKSLVEHHCACKFVEPAGPPVKYCAHHATQRDRIEELEAERDKWIKKAAAYTANWLNERDHSAKLEKVREAAKALFEKDIFWNPDSGGYDLAKPRGSMNELREALAACEDKDND